MKAPLPLPAQCWPTCWWSLGSIPLTRKRRSPTKMTTRSLPWPTLSLPTRSGVCFLCISIFPPEQRHQRVWEDPQGEQGDDHGGCLHKRAHRRLAEEHQNPGLNVYSWDPCSEYNLPNRTRCWSNWSSHTPGSRSSSSLGSWTSSLVTLRASSCPASLTTP